MVHARLDVAGHARTTSSDCQQALKVDFARDFTEDLLNDLVDPSPLRRLARYLGMKDELSLFRFTSRLSHPANDMLKLRRGLHINARTSNRYLLHERIPLVKIEALSLPRARRLILRRALWPILYYCSLILPLLLLVVTPFTATFLNTRTGRQGQPHTYEKGLSKGERMSLGLAIGFGLPAAVWVSLQVVVWRDVRRASDPTYRYNE